MQACAPSLHHTRYGAASSSASRDGTVKTALHLDCTLSYIFWYKAHAPLPFYINISFFTALFRAHTIILFFRVAELGRSRGLPLLPAHRRSSAVLSLGHAHGRDPLGTE